MVENTSPAGVTADLSDQQVEEFFETGGEINDSQPTEENAQEQEDNESETQGSEDQDNTDGNQKFEKKVNYGALHEEREKRKELQRKVQDVERKNQRMEETFQQLIQKIQYQQAQPPHPQMPSYEEDPVGSIRARQEQIERFLAQQQQQSYEQQQLEQTRQMQYTAQQQFLDRYQKSAEAYKQEKPDFKEAYQHLVHSRVGEYQQAGYSVDEARRLLEEDEAAIVAKAYNDGVNPAERIYNLARARGFQGGVNANKERIEQLEKGVQASRSLSNVSGKPGKAALRLEDIANLSDEEFSKVDWNKVMSLG
jgi:hypothetical protein